MEHYESAGIKVNYDKCNVKTKCIFFHNLYMEGVKPDTNKVFVIKKMQPSINK